MAVSRSPNVVETLDEAEPQGPALAERRGNRWGEGDAFGTLVHQREDERDRRRRALRGGFMVRGDVGRAVRGGLVKRIFADRVLMIGRIVAAAVIVGGGILLCGGSVVVVGVRACLRGAQKDRGDKPEDDEDPTHALRPQPRRPTEINAAASVKG
jgi:hypothetical protein